MNYLNLNIISSFLALFEIIIPTIILVIHFFLTTPRDLLINVISKGILVKCISLDEVLKAWLPLEFTDWILVQYHKAFWAFERWHWSVWGFIMFGGRRVKEKPRCRRTSLMP